MTETEQNKYTFWDLEKFENRLEQIREIYQVTVHVYIHVVEHRIFLNHFCQLLSSEMLFCFAIVSYSNLLNI